MVVIQNADAGRGITRVWLTVAEAAQYTGVSRTELYAALQTGDLTGSQRSKRKKWRVHVDDIDAWMRGHHHRGVA